MTKSKSTKRVLKMARKLFLDHMATNWRGPEYPNTLMGADKIAHQAFDIAAAFEEARIDEIADREGEEDDDDS